MSELKPQYTESWPTWPTSLQASWSLSTLRAGRPDRPRHERVDASVRWGLSSVRPCYERVEASVRWELADLTDLATSELKPQYAESWPTWPTSPRASWCLSTLRAGYERENSSVRWGLNSDPTSLRAREYLSMLRTQLDPTSLRAREYLSTLRTQLGSDLATSERIPQYAEDSTRIRPLYERENTSVRWGLNSDLTSLRAREYLSTLRIQIDSTSLRAREYLSTLRTQLTHFILLVLVRWELNVIILFYLCYVEVSLGPTSYVEVSLRPTLYGKVSLRPTSTWSFYLFYVEVSFGPTSTLSCYIFTCPILEYVDGLWQPFIPTSWGLKVGGLCTVQGMADLNMLIRIPTW